jgi:CMP-N-acetylneuraminic acid synthetase
VTIAYIPARGNSKGLQNKNLRLVAGKSLIQRTVETAVASEIFDCVYLDTDSSDIAEEGQRWGACVPFLREPQLAQDGSLILDCILNFFHRIDENLVNASEAIFLLQPTSPLRKVTEIHDCFEFWNLHDGSSCIATVSEPLQSPKDLIVSKGGSDWLPLFDDDSRTSNRQSLNPTKFVTGSIYVFSLEFLNSHKSIAPITFTKYFETSQISSIDVDTEFDLRLANLLCD